MLIFIGIFIFLLTIHAKIGLLLNTMKTEADVGQGLIGTYTALVVGEAKTLA